MTHLLSVNQALRLLHAGREFQVCVVGILHFEFEHMALWHYPKAERNQGTGSRIWLDIGDGSLQFNVKVMQRFNGHRVQVLGALRAPSPGWGGCGHMSQWPAEILVNSIDRL